MTRDEQIKILKAKGFVDPFNDAWAFDKSISIFDGVYVHITVYMNTDKKIETAVSVCYGEDEIFLENTDDLDIPFDGDVNICIDKARERIVAELQDIIHIVESNLRGVETGDGN